MTIMNEDWEHCFHHEAMFSIEEQMQMEEDFWQYEEDLDRIPAKIEVKIFNTPIYENRRTYNKAL